MLLFLKLLLKQLLFWQSFQSHPKIVKVAQNNKVVVQAVVIWTVILKSPKISQSRPKLVKVAQNSKVVIEAVVI